MTKFKIGDEVRIIKVADKRSCYKGLCNHTGIVKYLRTYVDETTYYLELKDRVNPAQEHGWFVYEEQDLVLKSSENTNISIGIGKSYIATITQPLNYITIDEFKKENKEMELLEIYFEEKQRQLEIKHDAKCDKIKLKDPIIRELEALAEKYKNVKGLSIFANYEYQFSKEIYAELDKCENDYKRQKGELIGLKIEIVAQLDLCETYEQKQAILKAYGVIDEQGKLNK